MSRTSTRVAAGTAIATASVFWTVPLLNALGAKQTASVLTAATTRNASGSFNMPPAVFQLLAQGKVICPELTRSPVGGRTVFVMA